MVKSEMQQLLLLLLLLSIYGKGSSSSSSTSELDPVAEHFPAVVEGLPVPHRLKKNFKSIFRETWHGSNSVAVLLALTTMLGRRPSESPLLLGSRLGSLNGRRYHIHESASGHCGGCCNKEEGAGGRAGAVSRYSSEYYY